MWQAVDYFLTIHAYRNNREKKVEDITRLVVLTSPCVSIVEDAAFLVRLDNVTLHQPLNGRLTINDVFVCFSRNVLDGNVAIVDDSGLILFLAVFRKRHLVGNGEVSIVGTAIGCAFHLFVANDSDTFGSLAVLVIEMQVSKFTSSLFKGEEVLQRVHDRNTRQRLFQVSRETCAVILAVASVIT